MFSLTQDQLHQATRWIKRHKCTIKEEGAIGGKITYCFTPTGIGMAESIKCACGQEKNLADYESW